MQIVRFKQGKSVFEIGCKAGAPLKYRKGQLSFENVMNSEEIWRDIRKADRPPAEELMTVFNSTDFVTIAKVILEKGEIQYTDAERKDMLEKKRNEIVNYFHKYYIDPKSKTVIPVARIDNALTELKIKIDIDAPTEKQTAEIAKRLPEVLPLKRAEIIATVTATHQFLAPTANIFKKYNILVVQENYTNDGCKYTISMVPGDYDKVINDLNTATKGSFEFEMEGGGMDSTPTPEKGNTKSRGKKK